MASMLQLLAGSWAEARVLACRILLFTSCRTCQPSLILTREFNELQALALVHQQLISPLQLACQCGPDISVECMLTSIEAHSWPRLQTCIVTLLWVLICKCTVKACIMGPRLLALRNPACDCAGTSPLQCLKAMIRMHEGRSLQLHGQRRRWAGIQC